MIIIRKRLVFKIVLLICIIIGILCLPIIGLMVWSRLVPCTKNFPVSFTIDDTGKSDNQIAEEVVSRYLDQSVFPHSCPDGWILQHRITDLRRGYPMDQMVWLVTYEISPFPGNDFDSNISLSKNGNIGEFRIFTFTRAGNVYTITGIASGG